MASWPLMGRLPPTRSGESNTNPDQSVHSDEPTQPWAGGTNIHSEQLSIDARFTNNFQKTPCKDI